MKSRNGANSVIKLKRSILFRFPSTTTRSSSSRALATICILLALVNTSCSYILPASNRASCTGQGRHQRHGYRRARLTSVHGKKQTSRGEDKEANNNADVDDDVEMAPICRIVTRADSKLPTSSSMLPPSLSQSPHLLDKLDAFYHAQAHKRSKTLSYLERTTKSPPKPDEAPQERDTKEEAKLVYVVRSSLEDAGFVPLSRRDIDLCESLNVGYLLRLSIVPDVGDLDPGIAQEFYPERFHLNGTVIDKDELLFDGRVLMYWRGYSQEVTQGRLLLPKIDYLQASLVQRSAAWVKMQLDKVESGLVKNIVTQSGKLKNASQNYAVAIADSVPVKWIAQLIRNVFVDEDTMEAAILKTKDDISSQGSFKLGRYGGSKIRFVGSPDPTDSLDPFTICEVNYKEPAPCPNLHESYLRNLSRNSVNNIATEAEHDMYEELNNKAFTCEYDEKMSKNNAGQALPMMQLLERVSISNLVDLFTKAGRRELLKTLFAKSELVEPTYEEVVVVWRPLIKEKLVLYPPKVVSELADMFDIEGFEGPPKTKPEPQVGKLELRNFEGVPMSNLPAVLPKTKLIFRPADAFLFDLISFVTFVLVASSIRLDSPRLDLLAIISVSLWTIRTVIRYSNKLARYDLLVKKFLTSKIAHRNAGAVKYLSSEAGSQRAIRAAVAHSWIHHIFKLFKSPFERKDSNETPITRSLLRGSCATDINKLLKTDKQARIDVDRALEDLESLGLVRFSENTEELVEAKDAIASAKSVEEAWVDLLEQSNVDAYWEDQNSASSTDVVDVVEPSSILETMATRSLEQLEQRRNKIKATLEASRQKGYAKAKQILQENKDKGVASLKTALEEQKDSSSFRNIMEQRLSKREDETF